VEAASKCDALPGANNIGNSVIKFLGTNTLRTPKTMTVDDRHLSLLDLQLKAGRFFSKEFSTDSFGIIINSKAVEDFGLKNPIGSRLLLNQADDKNQHVYTVIGVVKDFHFQSLYQKIAPLVLINANKFGWGLAAVRIEGGHFKNAIAAIEKTWKSFMPKQSLHYSFFDKNLADQYRAEQTTQKTFTVFSLFAIFIACIGLFGLATYATLQRTKEISIRKVLGASAVNIVSILSKNFLRLVMIAILIAFPIAFWAMDKWLQDYAYRVDISWWMFLLAGIIAAAIALVTISFQAIKAAIANPITNLRTE
jgi:putative ABC transport system permease protein